MSVRNMKIIQELPKNKYSLYWQCFKDGLLRGTVRSIWAIPLQVTEYNLTPDTLLPVQTVSAPNQVVLAGSDMSHRTHRGCKAGLLSTPDTLAFWDNVYQDSNCLYKKRIEKQHLDCHYQRCIRYTGYTILLASFGWSLKLLYIGHLAFIIVSGCGPNSLWRALSSASSSSVQFDVSLICWSSGSFIFGTLWNQEIINMVQWWTLERDLKKIIWKKGIWRCLELYPLLLQWCMIVVHKLGNWT